ncbi:3-oxoacyl-[acyl-carrier-protein] synthase II [Terribacillus halophilus]|uniref:3-oxoacyl-[acyl-carrier-protein] synthase II n=1 Tax=Terribacillus halophilus TaxID=361279 RepID=A0A1G6VD00_9BACI|nr:beta-ketoacyl-[acyl-carrier-protein] synthase family protein [Terribacillus halophilus]SDD51344.1 3-oxoacyl-[acyl-carrier-protein] synthase II [Terribacillus halophilus]
MIVKRVVITGIGLVTANGITRNLTWESVLNLENGLVPSPYDNTAFIGRVDDLFNETLTTKDKRYMDRCTQMALVASREALQDANLHINETNSEDISVYVGSSVGGIQALADEFGTAAVKGVDHMTMLVIPRNLINMIPANISIDANITGETLAYANACASGTIAIGEAFKKIQSGNKKIVIAGGAEACVIPQVIEAFRKLRALTNSKTLDQASVPFSRNRSGFVMSEGAAFLVLEEIEHAKARDASIYCEIEGYGCTSDAKSLLAPDLNGVSRCMANALKDAGVHESEVEYINAHGTSTKLNDSTESAAIRMLFGDTPYVSSTKSLNGHALGAAGAIEAALCSMMIKNRKLIPTINVTADAIDEGIDINLLLNKTKQYEGGKVLTNSFAFGGHNASLLLADYS